MKLQAANPTHQFVYQAPLEIADRSSPAKHSIGILHLDRLYGYASRNPDHADAVIEDYLLQVSRAILDFDRPVSKSDILLAVRDAATVERSLAAMGTGPRAAYPRKLTPSLTIVPIINLPATVKYVGQQEIQQMDLDESQLFALGERNLRAAQEPFAAVAHVPPTNGIGIIREEFAASRLIFVKDWSTMAKALGGHLVVMAPAYDTVIFGDGSTPVGIDALTALGRQIAAKSQVPLSPVILRFMNDHWEEIP